MSEIERVEQLQLASQLHYDDDVNDKLGKLMVEAVSRISERNEIEVKLNLVSISRLELSSSGGLFSLVTIMSKLMRLNGR